MKIRNCPGTGYRLVAVISLALGQAGFAHAASVTGPDVRIQYARDSLDTIEGATVLLKRIEAAAVKVCDPLDHADVASRARRDACRTQLTQAAVQDVNHATLLAVYASSRQHPRRLLVAKK